MMHQQIQHQCFSKDLKSKPEDVILLDFQLLVEPEQLLKEVGEKGVAGGGLVARHLVHRRVCRLHRVVRGVRLRAAVLRFQDEKWDISLDFKMRNGTFCQRPLFFRN